MKRTTAAGDAIREAAQAVESGRAARAGVSDVVRLAGEMSRAMDSYAQLLDTSVRQEFQDIAACIRSMKADIASLRAKDLQSRHLPTAGRELDAVITATEDATNTIMEHAEAIMAAGPMDAESYRSHVETHVTGIFEACSFQDITGQRITRVVETLHVIEARVSRFAGRLDAQDADAPAADAGEERRRRLMLNGPAAPDEGIGQREVDELLRGA